MTSRGRLAVIGSLYEAIGEEGAVPHAMATVSAHLGASLAFWYVIRKGASGSASRSPFLFDGALGVSAKALQEFRDEMWRHDYALGATSITNRTTETRDFLSPAELARNDYAQWLRQATEVERRIGRSTDFADGLAAGWSFHMPVGVARRERERTEFDALAPHLRNLFRYTSQFGDLRAQVDGLEQAVNAHGDAVLLLTADGIVCWASDAAERLCARNDGIGASRGRVTFARSHERRVFDALLHGAADPAALGSPGVIGRLVVERPSGAFPFVLELMPAPPRFSRQLHGRGALVLTIHDPDAAVDPRPERWRAMFGLTRMEARVAMLTMRGLADEIIAAELGIGIGTVRTHQKQLLAKTETRSKAEAAHLLTRLS